MSNREQEHELMLLVQKFYARIGTIANEPHLLTQEEGHKLIHECTLVIDQLNKMPDFNAGPALLIRFESIKHKLLASMMRTPTNKTMDDNGNIVEEE